MPVTDGERVNVFDRRIIGAIDFDERMLAFLETATRRHLKGMLTGATPTAEAGTWLTPVTVTDGAGAADLTFGQMYGTDGNGEYISVAAADARLVDVPFEDAGVTYYMATRVAEVPVGVQADVETGDNAYDYFRKDIGHRAEPTVVVDSGGFLTITIGNHDLASDDFTGRQAVVFLKSPVATTASTAIETVSVVGTTVVTVGTLGQSSVSTTASDYEVILMGPTITRSVSVATAALWAFIGTVVGGGSPRVFDTSSQPAVIPLNELANTNSSILSKGWVVRPTITLSGGGATVNIASVGSVYTQGRLLATPSGAALTGFPATSDIWISYNIIAGDFTAYTTWDTANAGTNVPLFWAKTDGGSLVTFADSERIGRIVANFPQSILMTVGGETAHAPAFPGLRSLLGHLGSLQDSAAEPPRSFRVQVVGQVDITTGEHIAEAVFYDVKNVHFVGAEAPDVSVPGAGPVIQWDGNTSALFTIPSGSTMSGWTFEGINFRHTGAPSSGQVSVVHNSGTVTGLKFKGCTIGQGTLPAVVYSVSALNDVALIDCRVAVSDVVISHTVAATNGIDGLRILNCKIDQTGLTKVGSDAGLVRDLSIGGVASRRWRIADNEAILNGQFIHCEELFRAWVRDNDITIVNVNVRAIDIGVTATTPTVERIWIHDNLVDYPGAALFTLSGAIRVRGNTGDRQGVGKLVGIYIHNNMIDGTGYTAGNGTGLEVAGTEIDGTIIAMNMVSGFTVGVDAGPAGADDAQSCVMLGNCVEGGDTAFILNVGWSDSIFVANVGHCQNNSSTILQADAGNNVVYVGNALSTSGTTTSTTVDIDSAGANTIWVGNYLLGDTAVLGDHSGSVFTGNFVSGDTTWIGSSNVFAGNRWSTGTHDWSNSNDLLFSGNYFTTLVQNVGAGTVFTGNRLEGLTFNEERLVMVGNYISDQTTSNSFGASSDFMAITGNLWRDAPNFNAASQNWAMSGNVFEDATAWSLDSNQGALTGNLINPALTLAAGSNDIAAVGNRLNGGAITDSGTGNTVASNDI